MEIFTRKREDNTIQYSLDPINASREEMDAKKLMVIEVTAAMLCCFLKMNEKDKQEVLNGYYSK